MLETIKIREKKLCNITYQNNLQGDSFGYKAFFLNKYLWPFISYMLRS